MLFNALIIAVLGYLVICWYKEISKKDEISSLKEKLKLEEENHNETKKYYDNQIKEMQFEFDDQINEKDKTIDDLMNMFGLSA